MCRLHQLYGGILITFGIGVMIGMWLEACLWSYCLAIGLSILGIGILRR